MVTQKKYMDIERVKPESALTFKAGEPIVVEEKIDFSNSSIRLDMETSELVCFSRRMRLDESNTLNGFTNMVKELDTNAFQAAFGDRYIVFGEWAGNPHKIKYPDSVKKKLWVFDIWDTFEEKYVDFHTFENLYIYWTTLDSKVKELCPMVPVLYKGPFISWNHLKSLCGTTMLNAEPCGEGIVIKRQAHLDSHNSRIPTYVKLVHEKFSEVSHTKKPIDPETIKARETAKTIAATVVTERRIEKALEKFTEDGIIPENWNTESMSIIAKNLPKAIYEDCLKEESETVASIENFGKICTSMTMDLVKKILMDKNKI